MRNFSCPAVSQICTARGGRGTRLQRKRRGWARAWRCAHNTEEEQRGSSRGLPRCSSYRANPTPTVSLTRLSYTAIRLTAKSTPDAVEGASSDSLRLAERGWERAGKQPSDPTLQHHSQRFLPTVLGMCSSNESCAKRVSRQVLPTPESPSSSI